MKSIIVVSALLVMSVIAVAYADFNAVQTAEFSSLEAAGGAHF